MTSTDNAEQAREIAKSAARVVSAPNAAGTMMCRPDIAAVAAVDALAAAGLLRTEPNPAEPDASALADACGEYLNAYHGDGDHLSKLDALREALSAPRALPGWVRMLGLTPEPWGHWCCQAGAVASPGPCPWHGTNTDSPLARTEEADRA